MSGRKRSLLVFLVILLVLVVLVSSGYGAMKIAPLQVVSILLDKAGFPALTDFGQSQANVLWSIRLPRVMLGILIGAGLAVSGASLQGLFRNPLADPTLIGVSSGASLCAVVMIVVLSSSTLLESVTSITGYYTMNVFTFLGAGASAWIVYLLSKSGGKASVTTMLLAGIAVNALCGALTGLIIYYSTDAELRNVTFWMLGSLGGASWNTVWGIFPFIFIPVLLIPRLSKGLNAFALGEAEASHLGVPVSRLKLQVLILTTMAVGASVAVAGIIGFVGLIIPHLLRLAAGPDNRFVLIASSLLGALLLTGSDLIARTIIAPAELPIGIITAIVGTPVFMWILFKHKPQWRTF
jgi:iron complex transport system permease protein